MNDKSMYTIVETETFKKVETETFKKRADRFWTTEERLECFTQIANDSFIGNVIPKNSCFRKVSWSRSSMGKRGGVRLIYFNVLEPVHD